jgi:hypothetical protein
MNRTRAIAALLVNVALVVMLHELRRRVAAPPSWTPHDLAAWIERHDAATVAVSLARIVALAVAAYLAVVSAAALALDLLRVGPSWPAKFVPTLLRGAIGVGVAGALSVPAVAAANARDVPVLVQVDTAPSTTDAAPPPTLVQVGPASTSAPTSMPVSMPAPSPVTTPPSTVPDVPADAPQTWQVRPGDHFWSIAERTLAAHGVDTTEDAAVARYWRVLVDANRDRLVVPGNPDLIVAGQQLVVPEL